METARIGVEVVVHEGYGCLVGTIDCFASYKFADYAAEAAVAGGGAGRCEAQASFSRAIVDTCDFVAVRVKYHPPGKEPDIGLGCTCLVDVGVKGQVLHHTLEGAEKRLGKAGNGLSLAVEGTYVVFYGHEGRCNRRKVKRRCVLGKQGVKARFPIGHAAHEILESIDVPYLDEVAHGSWRISHVRELAHRACSYGIVAACHYPDRHASGRIVYYGQRYASGVGAGRNGHVEYERIGRQLDMMAELI